MKGSKFIFRRDYHTVGIVIGLSILQNGKLPQFMNSNTVEELFHSSDPSPCILNLRNGLAKLGIYQICVGIPTFIHLFQPNPSSALTVKKVVTLLTPLFSEEGSNKRTFESKVYSLFLKYLREVASGRRNRVSLSSVIQFTTGADEEPALGFVINPTILFVEFTISFVPTANTCINCLKLPRPSLSCPLPSSARLFHLYDYAFTNAFFGNV
ncbi:uncharacterized protein [Ptychodera flava]|uniref:uncharacterized protein n=1 Tax=Ptychodera flava TaxID=63121 RepID=UPI00396A47BD